MGGNHASGGHASRHVWPLVRRLCTWAAQAASYGLILFQRVHVAFDHPPMVIGRSALERWLHAGGLQGGAAPGPSDRQSREISHGSTHRGRG